MGSFLFLLIMAAAMWLLLIRPQQQRVKQQRMLVESLTVGQRVVTAGGVIGTISAIDGNEIDLTVAPGTTLRVLRMAVARPLDLDAPAIESGEEQG